MKKKQKCHIMEFSDKKNILEKLQRNIPAKTCHILVTVGDKILKKKKK